MKCQDHCQEADKNDETTAKELQRLLDGRGLKLLCYRTAISVFFIAIYRCAFVLPFDCFKLTVQRRQNVNFLLTHTVAKGPRRIVV